MLHSFIFFLRRFLTVTVRSYWNSHILFFKCYFSSSISDLVNLYTLEAFAIHIIAICRFPIDSWIPIDFLHIHVPGERFLVTHKWTSVAPRWVFCQVIRGDFWPIFVFKHVSQTDCRAQGVYQVLLFTPAGSSVWGTLFTISLPFLFRFPFSPNLTCTRKPMSSFFRYQFLTGPSKTHKKVTGSLWKHLVPSRSWKRLSNWEEAIHKVSNHPETAAICLSQSTWSGPKPDIYKCDAKCFSAVPSTHR